MPKKTGLSFTLIVILFGVKVLYGCVNLYFHNTEYVSNDSHYYFLEAMNMLNDFGNKPLYYLKDWFFNWGDLGEHINFFDKANSTYWSDLGRLLHQRLMILFTALSFGHEYVNILFSNCIYFIGLLALYKSFVYHKPDQKWLFVILIFLIPSITFWCSGIHKDGYILALFGGIAWSAIKYFDNKSLRNVAILTLFLFLLLVFRYYYLLLFLPLFFVYFFFKKNKYQVGLLITTAVLGVILFFTTPHIIPSFNPLKLVTNRQEQFLLLRGYSDLKTPALEPTFQSFIKAFPTALEHVFIEPLPQVGKKLKYDITALDSALILVLFIIGLLSIKRRYLSNGFYWLYGIYSLLILTFIGYTIPNLGALVRYESPFICLLLLSLFAMGNFSIKKLPLQ